MKTTLISADELAARLDEPQLRIVDCRFQLGDVDAGRAAYLNGHIPGAVYAHLERDLSAPRAADGRGGRHPLPDRDAFTATLGQLGIGNSHQVVVYDDSGGAIAARLWWMLRWMGHGAVAVLDGGLRAWLAGGRTLDSGEVLPESARFVAGQPLVHTVDASQILAGDVLRLLDARSAERFAGEHEPIDAIAGHVPGAGNFAFDRALDSGGRFRRPDLLMGELRESLGDAPAAKAAAMCGSGVTACHLLLSLEVAGIRGAGLYAGSWSDWISDPSRPVATRDDPHGTPQRAAAEQAPADAAVGDDASGRRTG